MLLRLQSKRKQRKDHKSWMFKYKFDEEDQGDFRSRTRWTQEVPDVICFLLGRHLHLHLDCEEPELTGRKKNHGLFIRLHNKLKQQRCPKSWMFKFKTDYKPARTNHILHQKKKPRSFLEIEVLQEDVQHVPFAFLHMNANETRYAVRKPANQEPANSADEMLLPGHYGLLHTFDQCGGLNATVIAGTIMQSSLKLFHQLRVACLHHTPLGFLYGSLPRPPEENHSNFSNMLQYHETWSCLSLRTNRVWDPGGSLVDFATP